MGTDFETPLQKSKQIIEQVENFDKASIVFITDGESAVRDNFLQEFKQWKKEKKVEVISVLIDSSSNFRKTLEEFSNRIEKLSTVVKGEGEEIALSIFGEL